MIGFRSLAAVAAILAVTVATTSPASAKRHTHRYQPATYQGYGSWPQYQPQYQHQDYRQQYHSQKVRTARVHHKKKIRSRHKEIIDSPVDASGNTAIASGLITSQKTGAKARVAPKFAEKFQAYVDALEEAGASIFYMGGIRRGRCSDGHQHPCGKALDVCQDYRNHVSGEKDCNLPEPRVMAEIARSVGLYEGSVWCRGPDYGHAQVTETGTVCNAKGWAGKNKTYATITGEVLTLAESESRAAQSLQRRYEGRRRHHYASRRHYTRHRQYASRH